MYILRYFETANGRIYEGDFISLHEASARDNNFSAKIPKQRTNVSIQVAE